MPAKPNNAYSTRTVVVNVCCIHLLQSKALHGKEMWNLWLLCCLFESRQSNFCLTFPATKPDTSLLYKNHNWTGAEKKRFWLTLLPDSKCIDTDQKKHTLFAMAKIRRISHDHQAPFFFFFFLLSVLLLGIKCDPKQNQTAIWLVYLGPPRFSSNWPTGSIRSSSRKICPSVLSPSHAIV